MKLLKGTTPIMIIFIIITTLICNVQNSLCSNSIATIANPPNVGVLLFNLNDPYMASVKESLENIEKENPNKVRFSFYDAKDNQAIQNTEIDTLINTNIDLLLVNLVDTKESTVSEIIGKVKAKKIPLIFFNIELQIDASNISEKVIVISTDSGSSGIMQGEILVDLWKNNKALIDKNKDNVLQYIMLQGKTNNEAAINRTINSLFLRYGGKTEAIIANNDAMAVGAIEALQAYGYNKGDKTKTIPVVGIDAIAEARDLINKGFMTGTVIQDPEDLANALYSVGLNLVYNRGPLQGTDYKFAKQGVIEIPYYEYIP